MGPPVVSESTRGRFEDCLRFRGPFDFSSEDSEMVWALSQLPWAGPPNTQLHYYYSFTSFGGKRARGLAFCLWRLD